MCDFIIVSPSSQNPSDNEWRGDISFSFQDQIACVQTLLYWFGDFGQVLCPTIPQFPSY